MECGWTFWLGVSSNIHHNLFLKKEVIVVYWICPFDQKSSYKVNQLNQKMLFIYEGISKTKKYGVCMYDKWKFKPKITSIFHFEKVTDDWTSHILRVKTYSDQ